MTGTLPPARQRLRDGLLPAVAAAIALLLFVVGTPLALVALAPTYLSQPLPTLSSLPTLLTSPDDGTLLLAMLGATAWIAWALFTLSVALELAAVVRRASVPRIPLLGGLQQAAGRLVATAGILLATTAHASATPATAAQVAPVETGTPVPASAAGPAATSEPTAVEPGPVTAPPPTPPPLPTVVVQRGDTLWGIAERHLGDGARYTEIRDLNLRRPQPNGRTLTDADWIIPGWTLALPADATEPAPHPATPEPVVVVQPGDTLWEIAEEHLADGQRYPEIAALNAGVPQPDGRALQSPDIISPGWTLRLPPEPGAAAAAPVANAEPTPPDTTPPQPVEVLPPLSGDTALSHDATASAAAGQANDAPRPSRAERDHDARQSPEAEDRVAASEDGVTARWVLGLTALGAAGVLGEIARRRHLQRRARRPGEIIPLPEKGSPAETAERRLHGPATPVSIKAITTTLTNLGSRIYDAGRELPRLGALTLDEHHLTLLLVDDDPEAVAPFTAVDARTWTAPTTAVADEQPLNDDVATNPYPLLVTLGHTDTATLILNLEAAGTLTIHGDEDAATEVLYALVVELATSDLANQLCVVVDDALESLAGAFEPHRLRPARGSDDRSGFAHAAGRALAALGIDDTLQARGDRQPCDAWWPVVYVEPELHGEPAQPWSGTTVITRSRTSAAWTIQLHEDATAALRPLGVAYAPQRLAGEHLDAIRSLLKTSVPPTPRALTLVDVDQHEDEDEDITALLRSDPHLPEPWCDEETGIHIKVLGAIEIEGLPAGVGHLSSRMKELLVYLALRGPATGADLDDALWNGARIRPGTRNALVYRTRARVGEGVLPPMDANGRYRLGPNARTDWDAFRAQYASALAGNEADRAAALAVALELVRDRPMRGLGPQELAWADADVEEMTGLITDAFFLLARQLLSQAKPRDALDIAMRGLRLDPYSASLQQLALSAAELDGGPGAAAQLRQRFEHRLSLLDPEWSS